MRPEPTEVFRVVKRRLDNPDGEWVQHGTWTSRTQRPYITFASARGIATNAARTHLGRQFQWKIQRSTLEWEDV